MVDFRAGSTENGQSRAGFMADIALDRLQVYRKNLSRFKETRKDLPAGGRLRPQ
jgi:hypothetical protein